MEKQKINHSELLKELKRELYNGDYEKYPIGFIEALRIVLK